MHPNEQKRPTNWWLKTPAYTGFYIREISGLMIALFTINYTAYLFFAAQSLAVPTLISVLNFPLAIIGLIGALIHTFTWIPVLPKILPLEMKKNGTIITLIILLLLWLAISYALISIL